MSDDIENEEVDNSPRLIHLNLKDLPEERMASQVVTEELPSYNEQYWYSDDARDGEVVSVLVDLQKDLESATMGLRVKGLSFDPFELVCLLSQYCVVNDVDSAVMGHMLRDDVEAILKHHYVIKDCKHEDAPLEDYNFINDVWSFFNHLRKTLVDVFETLDAWTVDGYNPYIPVKELPGGLYLYTIIPHAVVIKLGYKHHQVVQDSIGKVQYPGLTNKYDVIQYRLPKNSPRTKIITLQAEIDSLQRQVEQQTDKKKPISSVTDYRDKSNWSREMYDEDLRIHARVMGSDLSINDRYPPIWKKQS